MDALTTPSNWQKVRLGDILELLTDYHANGSYELLKNNVTLLKHVDFAIMIRTTNFENNDFKNDLIYINNINKKAYEFLSKSKVFAGDILVNKIANAGTAYFMPKLNQPVSLGMNLFLLRIKPNYNNFFIFKQIANYERVLKTFANGSATKTITKNVIKNLLIPLPPLNEQIAIANVLSDVDHYLYSLDALILKKEGVKKALSFELLSQRKRLKGFNQNWQKVRLGDIANYLTSNLSAEQITQQGKIKVYDVNNFIGYTNTTFISDKPYISIVKDGSVGRVRILPPKTNILSTMGALVANHKTTTEFLFYLLSNFDFKNFTSGSIIPHIYFKDYKEKTIFLPPLNEQIAIANILSDLDHEIISLKNKKRQFDNIKKALNHDLMSAKIRVLKN